MDPDDYRKLLLFLGLQAYLGGSYCIRRICRNLDADPGGLAWIPGVQLLPLLRAAEIPLWLIILFPFTPLNLLLWLVLWVVIAKKLGRQPGWGLVACLLPHLAIPYLAFSSSLEVARNERSGKLIFGPGRSAQSAGLLLFAPALLVLGILAFGVVEGLGSESWPLLILLGWWFFPLGAAGFLFLYLAQRFLVDLDQGVLIRTWGWRVLQVWRFAELRSIVVAQTTAECGYCAVQVKAGRLLQLGNGPLEACRRTAATLQSQLGLPLQTRVSEQAAYPWRGPTSRAVRLFMADWGAFVRLRLRFGLRDLLAWVVGSTLLATLAHRLTPQVLGAPKILRLPWSFIPFLLVWILAVGLWGGAILGVRARCSADSGPPARLTASQARLRYGLFALLLGCLFSLLVASILKDHYL